MVKYIIAENIVKEINQIDELSASIAEDGTIEIESLVKCGDDLVDDVIGRFYHNEHLRFVRSDEASSIAYYKIEADKDEIYENVEGGIAVFDTWNDFNVWHNQD